MPDAFFDLCCLFAEAGRFKWGSEEWCNARYEVGRLAWAAGYTVNDLAKIVTYAG